MKTKRSDSQAASVILDNDPHRTRRGTFSNRLSALLCLVPLLLLPAVEVHGDFGGSYVLTPPDPGLYSLTSFQAIPTPFGNWSGKAGAAGIEVDTRSAPTNLVLSVDRTRGAVAGFGRERQPPGR